MSQPACRTCHCVRVRALGRLPDVARFAGRAQPQALPGGSLWRCLDCGFTFRHPLLASGDYDRLYRSGSLDIWDRADDRRDFDLVRQQFNSRSAALDVLDVGCFTGLLLSSLPPQHHLYGIEPNKAAAAKAAGRGIRVIADGFEDLARTEQTFDVITACDVIEHVVDPLAFLKQLRGRLKPGGRLIVTTGNCDAWLWRMTGSRFWYCYYPEHISFIGSRWLALMPGRAALRLVQSVAFNYRSRGFSSAIRPLLGACLHACSPRLAHWIRRGIGGGHVDGSPPGLGASRDHVLCVLTAV